MKYIITDDMKEEIRRVYTEKVGMESCAKGHSPVKQLAEKFGIPTWKVSRVALSMGLIAKQRREPNWSDTEKRILKKYAHRCPDVIRRHLKKAGYKRSVNGIIVRRSRMQLLQDLDGQSATSLAMCFGVDPKTVMRWIDNGWMRTEKRSGNNGSRGKWDHFYIKDKWVKKFIIENVNVIDFRKVDKHWLVSILTGEDV